MQLVLPPENFRDKLGEKPHQCSYCGNNLENVLHLEVHIPNHTGEKPYLLEICAKSICKVLAQAVQVALT